MQNRGPQFQIFWIFYSPDLKFGVFTAKFGQIWLSHKSYGGDMRTELCAQLWTALQLLSLGSIEIFPSCAFPAQEPFISVTVTRGTCILVAEDSRIYTLHVQASVLWLTQYTFHYFSSSFPKPLGLSLSLSTCWPYAFPGSIISSSRTDDEFPVILSATTTALPYGQ